MSVRNAIDVLKYQRTNSPPRIKNRKGGTKIRYEGGIILFLGVMKTNILLRCCLNPYSSL